MNRKKLNGIESFFAGMTGSSNINSKRKLEIDYKADDQPLEPRIRNAQRRIIEHTINYINRNNL